MAVQGLGQDGKHQIFLNARIIRGFNLCGIRIGCVGGDYPLVFAYRPLLVAGLPAGDREPGDSARLRGIASGKQRLVTQKSGECFGGIVQVDQRPALQAL